MKPTSKDEIEGFDDLSATEQNKVSTYILNDGDYKSSEDESSSDDDEPIGKQLQFFFIFFNTFARNAKFKQN